MAYWIADMYLRNLVPPDTIPRTYIGEATTINGVATFYLTDDETANGNAVLSGISVSPIATARRDTSNPVECPKASIKATSQDLKTITVNVTVGSTEEFAPDGTVVSLLVFGY